MNTFTPPWHTVLMTIAISLLILGTIFWGVTYYVDKSMPLEYKKAHEINLKSDNYINSAVDNALGRASEYFRTLPM